MCPQGLIQPSNAILYAGQPLIGEYEVQATANMLPGRLVITSTTEYDIKVSTSGGATVLGVLDVEPGERKSTVYDNEDQARVLTGDIVVLLTADSGCAITIGMALYPADRGMVQGGVTITAANSRTIGYALQDVSANTKANLLVKLQL